MLAFHLLLIAETEKEAAPSYVWRKGPKSLKYIAQNQRLPLRQTNFGTRKKKTTTTTKKETKRADEIVWEILCYYILTKRIVRSAKPAYLTLPVVGFL